MGLFSKRKQAEVGDAAAELTDRQTAKKPKSDKSIKERAPKPRAGLKVIRTCFWVFACFIFAKGCMEYVRGERVINQTIIEGNTAPVIEEQVKGFAADFASEYFTWSKNSFSERSERLAPFVSGIDSDVGLKSLDIKGSSRVLSTEVYDAKQLSDNRVEVTVMVRREVEIPPASNDASSATGNDAVIATPISAPVNGIAIKKAYMVVPVTVTDKGMVIRSYPRFVTEPPKADATDPTIGPSVSDAPTVEMATELASSFLRAWYEGNVSQLRYFYDNANDAPTTLIKSDFVFDSVEDLRLHRVEGQSEVMRITASVIVKSDIEESFTNAWSFDVVEKDGRLYVLKSPQSEEILPAEANTDSQKTPSPASTQQPAPAENTN